MWLAAASVAAPIIGGLIGNAQRASSQKEANALMQRAYQEWLRLKDQIPTVEEQRLVLEDFKKAGVISPEFEQAVYQQDSEMQSISTDPALKDSQMKALYKLQELGEGGMDLSDEAMLLDLRDDVAQQDKARREAVMQNMAARGMSGGGMELAAMLDSNQDSANRQSRESLEVARQAQQRALQSLMNAGQLGGDIRSQDFSEQARKAEAQDAINRFNTSMRADTGRRNVDRKNDAQVANLQNSQDLMNRNTAQRNYNQEYNKGLIQQNFQNQKDITAGTTNQYQNQAGMRLNEGDQAAQMWGGIGSGVGQMFSAWGSSDKKKKKDEV